MVLTKQQNRSRLFELKGTQGFVSWVSPFREDWETDTLFQRFSLLRKMDIKTRAPSEGWQDSFLASPAPPLLLRKRLLLIQSRSSPFPVYCFQKSEKLVLAICKSCPQYWWAVTSPLGDVMAPICPRSLPPSTPTFGSNTRHRHCRRISSLLRHFQIRAALVPFPILWALRLFLGFLSSSIPTRVLLPWLPPGNPSIAANPSFHFILTFSFITCCSR